MSGPTGCSGDMAGTRWGMGSPVCCRCSPVAVPLWKAELMSCSQPCQMPGLLQPLVPTAGSPGTSVTLTVLSSHLCHHAGVWAGRTLIPSVVVPLSLRPLQPLLLPFSIPALPSLCHEQRHSSKLHTSSPQPPGILAPGNPSSALGSVPPS